jgi:hypothetical protein
MKTAMEIMLDDLLAKLDVYKNAKMYESVATLETSINIAEALIEKEKDQICNAYVDGLEGSYMASEEYYNQLINCQNK